MKQLTAAQKHTILLEYQPRSPTHSFSALSLRHSIKGGKKTLIRWHKQWNRTIESLERKSVSGRPSILNQREVERYITTPLRQSNQSSRPIRYTSIAKSIREKTKKNIGDRTIQMIGKHQLGGRMTKGRKRTADECKCIQTIYMSK
jgi:transposase